MEFNSTVTFFLRVLVTIFVFSVVLSQTTTEFLPDNLNTELEEDFDPNFEPIPVDLLNEILEPSEDFDFNCTDRHYGYYADQDKDCRYFHICYPAFDNQSVEHMAQFTFLCPDEMHFSQEDLTCANPSNSTVCTQAHEFYKDNEIVFANEFENITSDPSEV